MRADHNVSKSRHLEAKEAKMEIKWQMNMLGVALSFGFVTAILLGML